MNEAHRRFSDWLTAGAEGDPPRDVAVHASVCTECRGSIAAFDLLANINPGMASMPAEPTDREHSRLAVTGRLAGATAVLFCAAILGVGVSQLIGVSRANGPIGQASLGPDQNVLGGTATAQPSPGDSGTPQETLTPQVTPSPTYPLPPVTPIPEQTREPTLGPTASPTPRPSSTAVPADTPTPTPTATPTPTPTPTPAPTAPDPPVLSATDTEPGQVTLSWTTPFDGGSPITGYDVFRDDGVSTTQIGTDVSGSPFTDSVGPGTYTYWVVAKNAIGNTPSNTTSGTST